MEKRMANGPVGASSSSGNNPAARSLQPNYNSRAVQEALEHLASIDLIELCNEAKVERCRATRDLRSCGRYVQSVLISCGHSSLCAECSQRCDICPICRTSIPKYGDKLRLRLYYECIAAGLISRRCDERFQEKEDEERQLTADVQCLYSLFDVAMENNLVSLICHYVTDVCMDETAASSDPVIAFLLDEVVVKDWCKQTFKNIVTELQGIYNLEVKEMKTRLNLLLKFSGQLAGLCNVLEVLESSFKGSLSAQLHDMHHLHESILKTKQHMEIMIWCTRHEFLDNVKSRYTNFTSWRYLVHERKSAAIKRAWPDSVSCSAESIQTTLFIEDALCNLETERGYYQKVGEELDIMSLQKDGSFSFFRSKVEGVAGSYPFENIRAAADVLFFHGSSDLVVAKQAIFLYYLFDRHWTTPDENWRPIVDDFAATFSVTRHSLLESFTFYLLDDHSDKALQEACNLLPEICGLSTHPKIAQVLLERHTPEMALIVLRSSGHDGQLELVSLSEAVTAVRVRVECALLTESFIHQRMLCTKIREKKSKHRSSGDASDEFGDGCRTVLDWVEILVSEICFLCIRRNLVDRMIELPWNSDEEKYLHKCLLEHSIDDPSTTVGSLLVAYYLQRYRYIEAFQIDRKLQSAEQDFISNNSVSEEVLSKMTSSSQRRTALVDKCIELLPQILQQQLKTGNLPEIAVSSGPEAEEFAKSDLPMVQEPISTSLLAPPASDSSLALWMNHTASLKPSDVESPIAFGGSVNNPCMEFGNHGSPIIFQKRLFAKSETGKREAGMSKSFKFDDVAIHGTHGLGVVNATPLKESNRRSKESNRRSSRVLAHSQLKGNQYDKTLPQAEQNGSIDWLHNDIPPYPHRLTSNLVSTPSSDIDLFGSSAKDMRPNVPAKRIHSERDAICGNMVSCDDPMDISSSFRENAFSVEERNINGGLRWRSDETSDEEEEQSPERATGVLSSVTPTRGVRRSRFAR